MGAGKPQQAGDAAGRLLPWALPALALLLWAAASHFNWVAPYLVPGPGKVGKAAWLYVFGNAAEGAYAGRFLIDARASVGRVFCGFLLASAVGLPLGMLAGRVSRVRNIFGLSVNSLRAVPGICWLPLGMVWFGVGFSTTIFLVALAAFFPIYLNAQSGARNVDPILLQAGAMMGVVRLRSVLYILTPAAMPSLMTGLRLGLGISWAYLVLGELTGVPNGLGAVIMDARMLGRIDIIVVGIVIIAVLGRLSDLGLVKLLRVFFRSARAAS